MSQAKKISEKEIEHLANLANLKLSKKELGKFQKQLSEILDYFNLLKEVKTLKIKPTSQVTGLENITEEDKVTPPLSQKDALSGSKLVHNDYFKVKAIFEESQYES